MKRILFPILATVLIAFAIVPLTAGTVFADEEDVYTVTVTPGTGTGTAFTVQSTPATIKTDAEMRAGNYDKTKGCFYRDENGAVWYHTSDNPFTAPEGKEFDCWACILEGSASGIRDLPMPAFDNSIITALWKKPAEQNAFTFSTSESWEIKYGKEENPFSFSLTKESLAQASENAKIQLYNSSFTCVSHNGTIPFTLTAGWDGETVENGYCFTVEQDGNNLIIGDGKINITSKAWENAKPGTYIASVETEVSVNDEICDSREIPFVLVVPDKYSLWVGDTQVTSENAANITGSNPVQASYDADSNTLTLNNYTYEGYGCDNDDVKAAIKARMEDDFTINLNGDNTVKHVYKETSAGTGIYADNNMTITGDGTLTVSDGDNADNYNSRGIRVGQELTIGSGAAVNAASGEGQNSYGVNVKKLTVQGELNADGGNAKNSYGAYTSNNVTVSKNGALNATGGTATKDSFGVFIYNKYPSMTIEGAMTARGNTFAIAKAADPNPSINTAAIQYTVPTDYAATQSENYDGSGATSVAAGGKTSETAKYVRIIGSAPVTGVSLNKTSTTLAVGDLETLTAALKPEYALHPDLVWESNDPSVATVSENGEVTAVAAGNATITVTATNGTEDTSDDKTATCDVTVKPMVKVTVPAGKTFTYNGKTRTGVAAGENYTLTGTTKAAKAGTYTAKATLNASTDCIYKWSDGTTAAKTIKWKINKAANPLKIGAKTASVKYKKLKKKAQTLAVTRVIGFTNDIGDSKTYTLSSAKKGKKSFKKYFRINKTTGKVTIKKNKKMKKGTYKVKVKIQALGNSNYNASAVKSVTFKVKVK